MIREQVVQNFTTKLKIFKVGFVIKLCNVTKCQFLSPNYKKNQLHLIERIWNICQKDKIHIIHMFTTKIQMSKACKLIKVNVLVRKIYSTIVFSCFLSCSFSDLKVSLVLNLTDISMHLLYLYNKCSLNTNWYMAV